MGLDPAPDLRIFRNSALDQGNGGAAVFALRSTISL